MAKQHGAQTYLKNSHKIILAEMLRELFSPYPAPVSPPAPPPFRPPWLTWSASSLFPLIPIIETHSPASLLASSAAFLMNKIERNIIDCGETRKNSGCTVKL